MATYVIAISTSRCLFKPDDDVAVWIYHIMSFSSVQDDGHAFTIAKCEYSVMRKIASALVPRFKDCLAIAYEAS